jgi:hypothetical protein
VAPEVTVATRTAVTAASVATETAAIETAAIETAAIETAATGAVVGGPQRARRRIGRASRAPIGRRRRSYRTTSISTIWSRTYVPGCGHCPPGWPS